MNEAAAGREFEDFTGDEAQRARIKEETFNFQFGELRREQERAKTLLGDVGAANLSREIAVVHRPVDGSLPVVIFDQDDLFSAEQRTLPQFQGAEPNNFSDAELISGHELGLHVGARFAAEGALLEIYRNAVRNNPSLSTLFTHNVDDFILRLSRIRGIDNLPERKNKE